MRRASCAARRRVLTKATGLAARWVGWLAARSAPASAARWAPSRACSEFRIVAIGAAIVAAAITTATTISTALGNLIDRHCCANGSRERAPDDGLHEAIHGHETRLDCFVRFA